jgi:hypothetical protein
MSARITNAQFATRRDWVTNSAREVGAIGRTDRIGTAVAWSMSYVCVYDVDGRMLRSLSQPMPMRGLFDYMGAMDDAYRLLIDARRVEKVTL